VSLRQEREHGLAGVTWVDHRGDDTDGGAPARQSGRLVGVAEGDTIHRAANRLRPALAGATLVRFEATRLAGDRPRAGELVEDVEAVGKHLLIHFSGGLSLRTHMRMSGAWHLYRTGERWREPAHLARVVIEVDSGWVAVCFSAPVVETYVRRASPPAAIAGLGPDLCVPADLDAVLDTVLERLGRIVEPSATVGEALLDQRVAAGIGNVYKSEACFAVRLDPFTPVGELDREMLRSLWATAARQLQANLGSGRRATYRGGLAVYGRRGRPCPRCGTAVRMGRQGEHQRSTYWCPTCQRRPSAAGA
jgi:endonuclease-8